MSAIAEAAEQAVEQALAALDAGIGRQGQWPGWVVATPGSDPGRRDIAAPVTALGMLALQGVPRADAILARSHIHLERTVLPGGMWRYYANIPPDTDDSAMCALALGPGDSITAQTRETIAATVLPDGRFPTWYEPGWQPVVDAVPNAHVVALLGERDVTARAISWLNEVVASGQEVESSAYYVDPLDLHVAIRRGVDLGVTSLAPALNSAVERALERLATGDLSPYRIAQAMTVADAAVEPRLRRTSVETLLDSRDDAGVWPQETMFIAGRTDVPGTWLYQSWSVVTALCVRALVR